LHRYAQEYRKIMEALSRDAEKGVGPEHVGYPAASLRGSRGHSRISFNLALQQAAKH
jgi:hypothetical protein